MDPFADFSISVVHYNEILQLLDNMSWDSTEQGKWCAWRNRADELFNVNLLKTIYRSLTSLSRRTADRTEVAAVVATTYAPPATVRLHLLQDQIPTQDLFIAVWKLKKAVKNMFLLI